MKQPLSASVEITPIFGDADPMGVVWHGNYFRFLEAARSALLQKLGYDYREMDASGYVWPIVEARMKYIAPVTFGQTVRVVATLREYENRLVIDYEIFDADGRRTTKAQTKQIAINKQTRQMCFASPSDAVEKIRKLSEETENQ
jgi:acyl-CoA thioester hydrolase